MQRILQKQQKIRGPGFRLRGAEPAISTPLSTPSAPSLQITQSHLHRRQNTTPKPAQTEPLPPTMNPDDDGKYQTLDKEKDRTTPTSHDKDSGFQKGERSQAPNSKASINTKNNLLPKPTLASKYDTLARQGQLKPR